MTPLARLILKDLTLPVKRRRGSDGEGLTQALVGAHFFDVSGVIDLVEDLAGKVAADPANVGRLGFLPAPKTWIEYDLGDMHEGYLLTEAPDGRSAKMLLGYRVDAGPDDPAWMSVDNGEQLTLYRREGDAPGFRLHWEVLGALERSDDGPAFNRRVQAMLARAPARMLAALALINSPKVVGRRQIAPHRGVERELLRQRAIVGRFPLQAWTEIVLEVTPPQDLSGEDAAEGHLTGGRALHFCRQFGRIRLGRFELVRSHWRGDAALGIKQSRYRVTPPRERSDA